MGQLGLRLPHPRPTLVARLNTLIYAVSATVGYSWSSIPVAYALAHLPVPWPATLSLILVIATMMLPPQVLGHPDVPPLGEASHLSGTLWPLIIPTGLRRRLLDLPAPAVPAHHPREYTDAAKVDGCGELRMLCAVVLPMASRPSRRSHCSSSSTAGTTTSGPQIYAERESGRLDALSSGSAQFRRLHHTDWNLTMAATAPR